MTPRPLDEIARHVNGRAEGDESLMIHGVQPFDEAGPRHITCAMNPEFLKRLEEARAGAVIVGQNAPESGKNLVRVDNPYAAFAKVIALFHPPAQPGGGISPMACIGEDFTRGRKVSIGPCAVIGDGVTLGSNVIIMPHAYLGGHVTVGDDVVIHPHVSILERCEIGSRVIIHAGTVIGSDGFGFAPEGEKYVKVPQLGIVRIDSDVEIGANNTIDRATFGKTWIKSGVKTDNQVHVAHNVVVGENTLLVAQVGISGSTTIGRHVVIAGQAGLTDHLTIGDNVIIAAKAGVAKSLEPGQVVSGYPSMPHRLWLRVQGILNNLPDVVKDIRDIKKRLARLEDE